MRRVLGGVLFALAVSTTWAACSSSSPPALNFLEARTVSTAYQVGTGVGFEAGAGTGISTHVPLGQVELIVPLEKIFAVPPRSRYSPAAIRFDSAQTHRRSTIPQVPPG